MPLVISVVSLCLCVAFFFFFRWYIARKTSATRLLKDYRAEVFRLIAEIDAATDRDSLLVEERVTTLRQLLEDTDRRISVYMRELQRSRQGEAMYASLGRGIRAALDSERPEAGQPVNAAGGTADTGAMQQAAAEKSQTKRKPFHQGRKKPPREKISGQDKPENRKWKVRIAELSAQGLTPPEIASRLNLSLTEVDLALNLLYAKGK